jgi:hypothetical protein
MNPHEFARRLIDTATHYVGLQETKENAAFGDSARAKRILRLMSRIEWWAPGAAYCAAGGGAWVVETLEKCGIDPSKFLRVWTAHCMTNVHRLQDLGLLSTQVRPGALWLARYGSTSSGHNGLVTADSDGPSMATVEGNTVSGVSADPKRQRQGDGFYSRVRDEKRNGHLVTQGFLWPEGVLKLCGVKISYDHAPTSWVLGPRFVRVQQYLEERGLGNFVKLAVKQPFSEYDPSLGYSMAEETALAAWISKTNNK